MRPFIGLPGPGTKIGSKYVVSREIGRGAVGVVFEARDMGTGESVAIKMLSPSSLTTAGVAERFQREAELSQALVSPHTVRVFDYDTYGTSDALQGLPYMVMGMLRGKSLEDHLTAVGRLSEADTLDILGQVLESLSEAHQMGIVHRDLKPDNIFLSEENGKTVVRVLDFGVAKAVRGEFGSLSRELTTVGMMLGTPLYMAPEQTAGKAQVTPALDVYAIGCIAYHMLTGRPPYLGTNPFEIALKHIKEPVPSFDGYARPGLAAVLEQALAKEPARRFPDARGLAIALSAGQVADDVGLSSELTTVQPAAPQKVAEKIGDDALGLEDSIFGVQVDDGLDQAEEERTLVWQNEAIAELTYQQENSRLIPVQHMGSGKFQAVTDDDVTVPLPDEPLNLSILSKILWQAPKGADSGVIDADSIVESLSDEDVLHPDTEPMPAIPPRKLPDPVNNPVPDLAIQPTPAPAAGAAGSSIIAALTEDKRLFGIVVAGVGLAVLGVFSLLVAIVLLVIFK